MTKTNHLDKFYTNSKIAKDCFYMLYGDFINEFNTNSLIIEPSAGCGNMLDVIPNNINKIGFDILPERDDIIKKDFLKEDIDFPSSNLIFFGNPPFGKKSKLAIEFINRCFLYSDLVAFILPVQFNKYDTQKQILPFAKLTRNELLPDNSFLVNGKPYNVRCCFQIWTTKETDVDLRLRSKQKTNHIHFKMYQYNCVEEAKKYFDYEWDFAVQRQGYGNYKEKIYDKKNIDLKKQWMLIKANSDEVLEILNKIDFEKLSLKNTSIPGFGKADVINEYERLTIEFKQNRNI